MSNSLSYDQRLQIKNHRAKGLWWRRFFIRLRSWEYWPVYVFNIPVMFTWWWNAIRARDLFFFATTNPGIPTGGFFGESKSNILNAIPDQYKPKTALWLKDTPLATIDDFLKQHQLSFPLIVKPEVGERGWLISRVNDIDELKSYLQSHPIDMILQPFLEWPMEVSIMVYKMPGVEKATVTSICQKEFLYVTGDGRSTLHELILSNDRAVLQYEKLKMKFQSRLDEILSEGEVMTLETIGNHCRGTKFMNLNHQIDDRIAGVMGKLLSSMPGVYYGRFDMKIRSWDHLREGGGIAVMEFNGTASDPAHIYDPSYPLWKAYRDIFFHWGTMRKIAVQNRRQGAKTASFKEMISSLILYFRYKRSN